MAKEFPIRLMVEEIALGTVLRKLHDMPGVVKLDLDFGHGGQGAGKEKLQQAAATLNTSPEEAVMAALSLGKPMKPRDIISATGLKDHRVYYAINKLGLKRNADGCYQLAPLASPAPAIKHGPSGRASPGSGPSVLRVTLASAGGPLRTNDLRKIMAGHGMSAKSISGVLNRAKRDGIIKGTKDGYVLTAKAEKMNGEAHG